MVQVPIDFALLLSASWLALRGRRDDARALAVASLGAGAYVAAARRLRQMEAPFPIIDLDGLALCPPGSFGAEYAAFMQARQRRPLRLSADCAEQLQLRHRLAVRCLLLFDALQLLLGFEAGIAGRAGVLAFLGAQHDGPACERAARWSRRLSGIAAPLERARIRRCEQRGRRLADLAPNPLLENIESRWSMPLDELRRSLRLPPACPLAQRPTRSASRDAMGSPR